MEQFLAHILQLPEMNCPNLLNTKPRIARTYRSLISPTATTSPTPASSASSRVAGEETMSDKERVKEILGPAWSISYDIIPSQYATH
jgi:hypothetical protein